MEEAYVYIKINKFNIIFPDNFDIKSEFPTSDWFKQIKIEGANWHKALWIFLVALPIFTITMSIDFAIWLAKQIVKLTMYISQIIIESFGKRIFGLLAIGVFFFVIFWLWESGKWHGLFDWLSKLFS